MEGKSWATAASAMPSLWIQRTCTLCDSGRYWSPLRKPTRMLESTQNEHTQCPIVSGHQKPGPSWFNHYAKVLPKIKLKYCSLLLAVPAYNFSGSSTFLLYSGNMHIWLNRDSQLTLYVRVLMNGGYVLLWDDDLSKVCYCLLPTDSGIGSSIPCGSW